MMMRARISFDLSESNADGGMRKLSQMDDSILVDFGTRMRVQSVAQKRGLCPL